MNEIGTLSDVISVASSSVRTGEDIFTANPHWMPSGRVFGGQVVAQSLAAAIQTVDTDRPAHSLHGYFLRPGDTTKPVTIAVDRIHDGRSFSTRRSQAYQDGVPIWSMIASFQHPVETEGFAVTMPQDVPEPESLPSIADMFAEIPESEGANWVRNRPVEVRHVDGPIYLETDGGRVASQAVWMRATTPMPNDDSTHKTAYAYASDLSILEPIMRRLNLPWSTPKLRVASLDHAMWFHRAGRIDDWVLMVQDAKAAQSSRGLAFGHMFSRDGGLIASVAQEGMIRVPATS